MGRFNESLKKVTKKENVIKVLIALYEVYFFQEKAFLYKTVL